MLLGWSSVCMNSAISHHHWPHYTGSLSTALNGQALTYTADFLQLYGQTQKLRSADKQLLSFIIIIVIIIS